MLASDAKAALSLIAKSAPPEDVHPTGKLMPRTSTNTQPVQPFAGHDTGVSTNVDTALS